MARATAQAAAARRRTVDDLDVRGASPSVIARAIKSDVRTVRRDLELLAAERVKDVSLAAERRRLLAAAKVVERTAWELLAGLPKHDGAGRLGALGKILAAQQRCADAVGELVGADLEARLAALEERLSTTSGAPPSWALSRRN